MLGVIQTPDDNLAFTYSGFENFVNEQLMRHLAGTEVFATIVF